MKTKVLPVHPSHLQPYSPTQTNNEPENIDDVEMFKFAVENVSDFITITDDAGEVVYVNLAVEKVTGFKPKSVLGKPAWVLWAKEERQKHKKELFDQVAQHKVAYTGEITETRKSGDDFIAMINIRPILSNENKLKMFIIIERDLSEQKVAEEQINKVLNDLQERSQKLAEEKMKSDSLLVNIGDGIIATDQDGNITTINRSAERMLGWEGSELNGAPITDTIKFVDEKDNEVPLYRTPTVLALSTGEKVEIPPSTTYYLVRKDKTHFPVGLTVTPYVFGKKIIGTIMVFRDITIEKNIDQAKSEFVSLASHQLRTPLTAINWYAELLLSDPKVKLTKDQKEYINMIYSGNQRMVELVNSLLNVSRLELGTFIIEPTKVDAVKIIKEVLDEQKVTILKKKLKISESYLDKKLIFDADQKLLRIVFQNLISNAVKYTPDNGEVSIKISKEKSNYKFEIADTGYGIPKRDQASIFSKLFRADNVKVKDVEGTGLGLYIVKQIIDNSSGKIWFESVEDKGTTFFVTLPLSGMPKRAGSKSLN